MRHRVTDPTVIAYNASIGACERGHQWGLAIRLFSELLRFGLVAGMRHRVTDPTVIAHNASIGARGRSHQWGLAISLFSLGCCDRACSRTLFPTQLPLAHVLAGNGGS